MPYPTMLAALPHWPPHQGTPTPHDLPSSAYALLHGPLLLAGPTAPAAGKGAGGKAADRVSGAHVTATMLTAARHACHAKLSVRRRFVPAGLATCASPPPPAPRYSSV